MALTSLQATIGKGKSWKTASFGSPTSKVYVDAINDSTKPATWRVVIQLANGDYGDTANMDPPLQPIPPSTPRQAGFRTYELGALFNNGNLGNFSATFSADREMTIKITQEIR